MLTTQEQQQQQQQKQARSTKHVQEVEDAYEDEVDDHDEEEEDEEEDDCEEEYADCEDVQEQNYQDDVQKYLDRIHYSSRYPDDHYEYRHVILPKEYYRDFVPSAFKQRLLTEEEWRGLGIQQSPGWVHYELHQPEPHIFLFRRPLPQS